jgi:lactate racemase
MNETRERCGAPGARARDGGRESTRPVRGEGAPGVFLGEDQLRRIVADGLAHLPLDGRRVLVIIPDGTRTMPMAAMFGIFEQLLGTRVAALDYLVALGTHQPMTDEQLSRLVGRPVVDGRTGNSRVFNHRWDLPGTFATLGAIPALEMRELTGGLLERDVVVSLNRLIFDYDHLLICGPVFPHEVVGFSGGNKYLFPGIAGPEIINFTHWLGALISNFHVIGAGYTRVRAVIDRAARLVDRPITCLALVVTHGGVAGLYVGSPEDAWQAAAALSARTHIIEVDRPFRRVLSVMPEMYDDLWTAAKGMYKLEPAVADGGEIVIYAPHITEVSYTHGALIDEIGYHCRDYFVAQWDTFRRYAGGVLAHSTHVKGLGRYDASTGIERPRIQVTLATGIPPERCRRINLGYLDPASVRIADWQGREEEGVLVVPRAGEMLYRLKAGSGQLAAGGRHA